MLKLLEMLDRTQNGPVCTLHDWDAKVIPGSVREKLKEHGLEKTCTPNEPVNMDDGLADQFFKAGYELAIEIGLLCLETERIIKVTEEELKEALRNAPKELTLGQNLDKVLWKARQPEDKYPPLFIAPLGLVVSEDIWIPLMQGIVEHRVVDVFQGGSLKTVFGRPIRSRSPYETLAGRVQAQLTREALWRAGRSGMCKHAVITSPTEFGQLGGYGIPGGFEPTDLALVLSPSELKTCYSSLHKVVHTINCGGKLTAGSSTMIGGYAGPPEGAVIVSIASSLLNIIIHQSIHAGGSIMDLRYNGNSGRAGVWANSVKVQALSRNTSLLTNAVVDQVAGPCTEMLLYESAVTCLTLTVSGVSSTIGPRSAGGKYVDYLTPLECKFCGEILKDSAGMSRRDVNEIAKKLILSYEDKLRYPPKGKSFLECYDLKTLQPSREWLNIYTNVKKKLVDLGVPLFSPF